MKKSASSHKNAQKKANSSPVQLSTLEQLRKENQELHQTVAQLEHDLQIAHDTLNQFYESDTFKLVRYYARIRNFLLPPNSLRFRLLRKVFVGIKKMLGLRHGNPRTAPVSQLVQLQDMGKYKQMDIITTKHTMFIARLIKKQLDRINVKCHIHVGQPSKYDNIPYIIICPQFVQTFPPVYFVFQMEQTVSSRWFTDSYNISLQNSCGILDYSLENVAFFHKPKYRDITSRVYYVPIDYCADYLPADKPVKKEYDVLFYGDPNCERRQRLLNALSKHFKVKICSEVFGDALYDEIRKAKVLINIHYYENSLLETTRLYEALSLNTCVIVSEDSHDQHEIGRLKEYVDFVPIDDEQAMIDRIAYWLSHDAEREEKVRTNQLGLEKRANAFDFFFYRFLLAHDRITFEDFYRLAGDYVQLHSNRICLSLPESTERRKSFDQDNIYGFECFPGLRHQKGWVGCGLSYKMIFTKATEAGMDEIMICEDDVIFPEDFSSQLDSIQHKLRSKNNWSIFSGVMADAGRIKVHDCEQIEDKKLIRINHMMSMVFNIYNRSMFPHICKWNEQNRDDQTNTIDRYLESKDLAVYVQIPFMVGHKEELRSTIWGFSNTQYATMISNTQEKLEELAQNYLDSLPS